MNTRTVALVTLVTLLVGCRGENPLEARAREIRLTQAAVIPTATSTRIAPTPMPPSPTPMPYPTSSLGNPVSQLEVILAFLEELGNPVPSELTGFFDDASPEKLAEGLGNIEGVDFEQLAKELENFVEYYRNQPLLHCNPDDIHELCPFQLSDRCLPIALKRLQIHGPEYNPMNQKCQGYFDDDRECKHPCTIWAETFIDEGCYAFLERPEIWFMEGEFYQEQLTNFFSESCRK